MFVLSIFVVAALTVGFSLAAIRENRQRNSSDLTILFGALTTVSLLTVLGLCIGLAVTSVKSQSPGPEPTPSITQTAPEGSTNR